MKNQKPRFLNFLGTAAILLTLGTLGLVIYKYPAMPLKIPLFYSHLWGASQLAHRGLIFLPLALSLLGVLVSYLLSLKETDHFLGQALKTASFFGMIAACGVVLRILTLTSFTKPYPSFLRLDLILPFLGAFVVATLAVPPTIKLAKRWHLMDDPRTRQHPAMLQTHPIPRAGGLPIFIGFIASLLIFAPLSKTVLGIVFGSLVAILVGLYDDRYDLNPYLRLVFGNILSAGIVIAAGVGIAYFKVPFIDKVVDLGAINFQIGQHHITLLADLFDLLWIVWVMNMLNWSKGVDGQQPGIVIIAALVIGILALRLAPTDPTQLVLAKIAFAVAGATLGFLIFNWHPSRILPGYSTTFLGLTLATLSIYSGAKVAIALLVLLVPTLDALAAILRRILRGQSPVWHDREHLHHRLLNRGWTHQQIAYFYWAVTALCGLTALLTAGKQKLLAFLTIGGIAAFAIALLNLKSFFTLRRGRLTVLKGEVPAPVPKAETF